MSRNPRRILLGFPPGLRGSFAPVPFKHRAHYDDEQEQHTDRWNEGEDDLQHRSTIRPDCGSSSPWFHEREQDGVADAEPGERDEQAVDPHPLATGRRERVLHGA